MTGLTRLTGGHGISTPSPLSTPRPQTRSAHAGFSQQIQSEMGGTSEIRAFFGTFSY